MTPEEINTRMNILLGLRGFSIVKLTEKTALWRMVSDDELLIDVSFPPELWEAKHAGKTLDWVKSPEMPANLKGMIEALVEDYTEALKVLLGLRNIPTETPSRIKLSDEDLIKKLDEIILNPGSADKTLWVKL